MNRTIKLLGLGGLFAAILFLAGPTPFSAQRALAGGPQVRPACDLNSPLCTEVLDSLDVNEVYTGHDEPSVLYYSNVAGSGNSTLYEFTLPKDPPTKPKQDGTGGTFNFQLHPAFWFGMDMCDSQSAPAPGTACPADTDKNIFTNTDPTAPDYIGKHPGGAFMEMQFYPPSWVSWPPGNSCDPLKWCAALNIDSLSENQNTGQLLNNTCAGQIGGIEYVNFAFITKNGVPQAPADPVDATLATFTPDPTQDLFMNSGDKILLWMHDTPDGFLVMIRDLSTGQSGSMKASAANSFGQVQFAPAPSTACTNIPYNFHPMYSTSSENTRLTWTAHSYNVAFADEIGHFEYCNAVDASGNCTAAGANDPGGLDSDDISCFPATQSLLVPISGCNFTDGDFDGVPYQMTWPGTLTNANQDKKMHPTSIMFTSPEFLQKGKFSNYDRVAFEADMPRIEATDVSTNNNCNRTTGAGCVNPPLGANFYPIFTTRTDRNNKCLWQLGGTNIPGTNNTFGGNSVAEYGPLLNLVYPGTTGVTNRFNDFRQVLSNNPCPSTIGDASLVVK